MNEPLVLVVESDDVRARLVARLLNRGGLEVIRLNEGLGVPDVVISETPRAVLVGTDLPDSDVEALIGRVRLTSSVPILALMDPDDDEVALLDAGVDGCVSTSDGIRTLVARVRAVVRMTARFTSGPLRDPQIEVGPITVDTRSFTIKVEDVVIALSPAEYEVLELLLRHPGAIVDRDTMYGELWGISYNGLDRALDQRISRLRAKLRPLRKTSIRSVRGRGYRLAFSPNDPRTSSRLTPPTPSHLAHGAVGAAV